MIKLGEELKKRLSNALTDGHPVVASYIDLAGDPHISFYGSLHAHSDDQLALWARDPMSDMPKAMAVNPKIGFAYSDMSTRTFYRIYGRARVETAEEIREKVYTEMHPYEQQGDPDRKGTAVIIDLDEVSGRDQGGVFSMEKD